MNVQSIHMMFLLLLFNNLWILILYPFCLCERFYKHLVSIQKWLVLLWIFYKDLLLNKFVDFNFKTIDFEDVFFRRGNKHEYGKVLLNVVKKLDHIPFHYFFNYHLHNLNMSFKQHLNYAMVLYDIYVHCRWLK